MNKLTGAILALCIVTVGVLASTGKLEAAIVASVIGNIVNALLPALGKNDPPPPPPPPPGLGAGHLLNGAA